MNEDWLTVKEYAAQMRVTDECVRIWLRRGFLVGRKTDHGGRGGKAPWRIANPQPISTAAYCQPNSSGAS